MQQASLFSSIDQGGGKRRGDGMQHDNAISAFAPKATVSHPEAGRR
jgi:hypothetical protein